MSLLQVSIPYYYYSPLICEILILMIHSIVQEVSYYNGTVQCPGCTGASYVILEAYTINFEVTFSVHTFSALAEHKC